ncbi:MAG: hypothetical protein ABI587_01790 [Gemmatimonadales bacterium]
MTAPHSRTRPEPFDEARLRIQLVAQSYGFRMISLEYPDETTPHAVIEFQRRGMAFRLVWEGEIQALFIEAARLAGNDAVSRWQDIEWRIAGTNLPLNRSTGKARIEELAIALERFIAPPSAAE